MPISRVRNIIDLKNEVSKIYETSNQTLTKAESSRMDIQHAMERKMENIMSRLKTRFDRETHRANNERIVHEYKLKKRLKEEMLFSQGIDNVF